MEVTDEMTERAYERASVWDYGSRPVNRSQMRAALSAALADVPEPARSIVEQHGACLDSVGEQAGRANMAEAKLVLAEARIAELEAQLAGVPEPGVNETHHNSCMSAWGKAEARIAELALQAAQMRAILTGPNYGSVGMCDALREVLAGKGNT